jgi:pyrrolidone-carboxylate peptidase
VLLYASDKPLAWIMTVQILATGFSVFPGAPENPTEWAIAELARTRWQPDGARLTTHTLPVRFDLWEREFAPLLARTKPDVVDAGIDCAQRRRHGPSRPHWRVRRRGMRR